MKNRMGASRSDSFRESNHNSQLSVVSAFLVKWEMSRTPKRVPPDSPLISGGPGYLVEVFSGGRLSPTGVCLENDLLPSTIPSKVVWCINIA